MSLTREEMREAILQAKDTPLRRVPVPEWGMTVHVRTLTARELDQYEMWLANGEKLDQKSIRSKLCSLTICTEQGELLFSPEDVEDLAEKSAKAVQRVFVVARRASGLTKGDIEELEKN